MSKGEDTKNLILAYAKTEFMEKGYKDASVRNVAKSMGLTTGAIFRYYSDKEAIFCALVEDAAELLYGTYRETQNDFRFISPEEKTGIIQADRPIYLMRMLDLIYEHFDSFKLIICHSEGTRYEKYIDRLVEIASDNTLMFIETLRKDGYKVKTIPANLTHIIYSANFTAIFEVVVHDMPKEEAVEYVTSLFEFFNSGWKTLLLK